MSSNTNDLLDQIPPFEMPKYFLIFDMEHLDDYKSVSNLNINSSDADEVEKARLRAKETIDILITGKCESTVPDHLEKTESGFLMDTMETYCRF